MCNFRKEYDFKYNKFVAFKEVVFDFLCGCGLNVKPMRKTLGFAFSRNTNNVDCDFWRRIT